MSFRSQTVPLEHRSSHSDATAEQETSSKDGHYELSQPPSPLTPLPSSSPRPFDVEDPTSNEDENFIVHPSPVSPKSLPGNAENTISPVCDSPSASAHSHLRISHAKLRSLPDPAVELDSDGEEMSSDDSLDAPTSSQAMIMSSTGSSYLDLVGTLPSEVGDFLNMVDAATSSDA